VANFIFLSILFSVSERCIDLKSLVVYYSRNGNTKFVAETIAAEIGADVEEIVDLKKRSGLLGFLIGGKDAMQGKETEIAPTTKSPADYDLIVVGTPNWASRITPATLTYLKKNNLSGKKVAGFFSQDGDKPFSIDRIKALVPNSVWVGEISIKSALKNKQETEKQLAEWCRKLLGKPASADSGDAFTRGL
jgi:flavodoxin